MVMYPPPLDPFHILHGHWDCEPKEWRPVIVAHALSQRVLAVANTRIEGAWCAYISDVPGMNHRMEEERVLLQGSKLPKRIAEVLFPHFVGVPYAD